MFHIKSVYVLLFPWPVCLMDNNKQSLFCVRNQTRCMEDFQAWYFNTFYLWCSNRISMRSNIPTWDVRIFWNLVRQGIKLGNKRYIYYPTCASGYDLPFSVYPEIVWALPVPQQWSVLTFVTLMTLAIDTTVMRNLNSLRINNCFSRWSYILYIWM